MVILHNAGHNNLVSQKVSFARRGEDRFIASDMGEALPRREASPFLFFSGRWHYEEVGYKILFRGRKEEVPCCPPG